MEQALISARSNQRMLLEIILHHCAPVHDNAVYV